MKSSKLIAGLLFLMILGCSDKEGSSSLKPLLIEQLKNAHTDQNWFVPSKIAIEGLTVAQSNWKDSTENHSIAELVSHLTFWNEMNLRAFKGEDMSGFNVENEITFKKYTAQEWKSLATKLDSVQIQWEVETEKADAQKIAEWSSEIANMAAHTAYHTGQIIYIRKHKGWWPNQ